MNMHSKKGVNVLNHLRKQDIFAYVTDSLPGNELFRFENHLADCDECARAVHHCYNLQNEFDDLMESFTLEDLTKKLLELNILKSLEDDDFDEMILNRIRLWFRDLFPHTKIVAGVTMDFAAKTAHLMEDKLPDHFNQLPAFKPIGIPAPISIKGAENKTHLITTQLKNEEIDIRYSYGNIKLEIKPTSLKKPWPLILFYPLNKAKSVIIEAKQPVKKNFLVADFSTDVIDSENFLILLECVEPTEKKHMIHKTDTKSDPYLTMPRSPILNGQK